MMNRTQFLLQKLAEECSEVAQRALKQSRFGRDEIQKGQEKTNKQRLLDEVMDLKTVLVMLRECGDLPKIETFAEFKKEIEARRIRIEKYYKYSQALGMIELDSCEDFARNASKSVAVNNCPTPRCGTHNCDMILHFYIRPGSPEGNGWGCPECESERQCEIADKETYITRDDKVNRVQTILGNGQEKISKSEIWSDLEYYSIAQTVRRLNQKYLDKKG